MESCSESQSPIQAARHFLVAVSSGVGAGARGCWRRGRVGAVAGWVGLDSDGHLGTRANQISGEGAEIWAWRILHVEKPAGTSTALYTREKILIGNICADTVLSQVKLLLPKFHRADSTLRSQAVSGVGVCASDAPPPTGWAD